VKFVERRRPSATQKYTEHLVFMRILLVLLTFATIGLSVDQPESLHYRLMQYGGIPAAVSLCVLAVLASTAAADVIVNDMMPTKYKFDMGARIRDTVWLLISATYLGYALVLVDRMENYGGGWLAVIFSIYAVFSACVAVVHVLTEVIERKYRE